MATFLSRWKGEAPAARALIRNDEGSDRFRGAFLPYGEIGEAWRRSHRHFGLDLRPLARGLLSQGLGPKTGARLRRWHIPVDRDQRYLLWPAAARSLRALAGRDARRLRLRHQGVAL